MINRTTRLRWRRQVRQKKRQVEGLSVHAEESIERHFFKRLARLATVRRFVLGWLALFIVLIGGVIVQFGMMERYYTNLRPVPGGKFNEGIVGAFTDANPLYATGPVDGTVARLLFSGLLRYDESNTLVGDLAESWQVDEKGTTYTVKLRSNLQWQDMQPLTAHDVVFTYKTIQNPDARSPLFSSWQGIHVTATDDRTVTFVLPSSLASFPHSLTNGIVPRHLLAGTPAAQLRTLPFNTVHPLGSGPFRWDKIEVTGDTPETREGSISLVPNELYHLGAPKLDQLVVRYFLDEGRLIDSFKKGELTAISGLDAVPDDLAADVAVQELNVPLTGQVMVFFKTTQEPLTDVKVRQALVQGVNQGELIDNLGFPVASSKSPLLPVHVGFDKQIVQLPYNVEAANKLLDEAGWPRATDGIRVKAGRQLQFNLYSQSGSEYAYVSQRLQADWAKIGVKVNVELQSDEDLQSTVTYHSYDALLYGISLGSDPDVFAYWHSSQASTQSSSARRVNFSEYKSTVADKALEAGRTRSDAALRAIKYKPFLEAWKADAPALALYEARFLYITRGDITNFNQASVNGAYDRYNNVHNWMIRREKVLN